MNLLREYIRRLLTEQDEELTKEQKIRKLFLSPTGGLQALELAELSGIDEKLLARMRQAIDRAHFLMSVYLESQKDWRADGTSEPWRNHYSRIHPVKLRFQKDLDYIANWISSSSRGIPDRHDYFWPEVHQTFIIDISRMIVHPERNDDLDVKSAEEAPAYIAAVKWAGEPE